jgi:hypothetical protein
MASIDVAHPISFLDDISTEEPNFASSMEG